MYGLICARRHPLEIKTSNELLGIVFEQKMYYLNFRDISSAFQFTQVQKFSGYLSDFTQNWSSWRIAINL